MATKLSILYSDLLPPRCSATAENRIPEEELGLLPPPISKLDGQEDLLLEILTRALTDPGSAARSRSVCKNWNSLLSNPYFFRRFIQHQRQRYVDDATLTKSILSFFFPMAEETRARFRVISRSKDLTLCRFNVRSLFVCNLHTKQLVALPPPAELPAWSPYCFLVCNPRNEHQFRVLLVRPIDRTSHFFCSESNKWRDCEVPGLRHNTEDMIVWNGKLYWLDFSLHRVVQYDPYGNGCKSSSPDQQHAIFLDQKIPVRFVLRVSGGDLHVVRLLRSGSLSVWRLEDEDSKEWRMVYEVYTDTLTWHDKEEEKDEVFALDSVLAQHPENPEVVFLVYFHPSLNDHGIVALVRKSVACNLRTRKLQRIEDGWSQQKYAWAMLVHNYNRLRVGCNKNDTEHN